MSEDVFAGLLGNFGDSIHPNILIDALMEHEFIRLNDSRTHITVLKEFTVYGVTYPARTSTNFPLRVKVIHDSYFNSISNRHIYE